MRTTNNTNLFYEIGSNLNNILQLLSTACRNYESGQVALWDPLYANSVGGYPAGALVMTRMGTVTLLVSTIDNNMDDPSWNTGTWRPISSTSYNPSVLPSFNNGYCGCPTLPSWNNGYLPTWNNPPAWNIPPTWNGCPNPPINNGGNYNPPVNNQPSGGNSTNNSSGNNANNNPSVDHNGGDSNPPVNNQPSGGNNTNNSSGNNANNNPSVDHNGGNNNPPVNNQPSGGNNTNNSSDNNTNNNPPLNHNGGDSNPPVNNQPPGGNDSSSGNKPPVTDNGNNSSSSDHNSSSGDNMDTSKPSTGDSISDAHDNSGVVDNTNNNYLTTVAANQTYFPLAGGNVHGTVLIDTVFDQNDETVSKPLGATTDGKTQFYLQLATNKKSGKSYGRLIMRDKDGNEHVGLQIDGNGNLTDDQGDIFLTKKEAEDLFIRQSDLPTSTVPIPSGSVDGELFSTATFVKNGETLTRPIGAQIGEAQFFMQLADSSPTADGVPTGRFVLRDKQGDYHKVMEFDDKGNLFTQNGNRLLEVGKTTGSGPTKVLMFRTTGGVNDNAPTIHFPEAFSGTPIVTGMITVESNAAHNPRFMCISANGTNTPNLNITNTAFVARIATSGGASNDVWAMDVIAVGPA